MGLGDAVATALRVVGITEERVRSLLGVDDCGCGERKEQLNALGVWARRVLSGKTDRAVEHLTSIFSADPRNEQPAS